MAFDFPNNPVPGDSYTSGGVTYVWDGVVWELSGGGMPGGFGDIKSCLQTVDHNGWILLDGRAISTLTPSQAVQASNFFGGATNLPNTHLCSLRQGDGTGPGTIGGSPKITLGMLPVHNLSITGVTTNSGGGHGHSLTIDAALNFTDVVGVGPSVGKSATGGTGYYYIKSDVWNTRNYNHGHTGRAADVGGHTHGLTGTLPLGGSGSDYWNKAFVVNFFVFLGP